MAGTRAAGYALGSLALACATYIPVVEHALESVVPHVARLVSNSFTLCAATSVLAVVSQLSREDPSATRPRGRRLVLAVAAMTALFAVWQAAGQPPQFYAAYVAVYIGSLAATVLDFLRQAWSRSRTASERIQRAGLRATAAGCVLALLYAAYKVVTALLLGLGVYLEQGYRCTTPISPFRCTFSVTTPALAVSLIAVGLTVPAVVAPISRRLHRRWETRSLTRLEPLWRDMARIAPDFVYDEGRQAAYEDADYVLVRRTAEIADGLLAVAPYRSAAVQQTARRRSRRKVVVEAAVLADAVRAHDSGEPFAAVEAKPARPTSGRGSLREETRWLVRLSTAYARVETTPARYEGAGSPT